MESMVICHPELKHSRPEAVYDDLLLNDRKYLVGLLDVPTRKFLTEEIHEECVLVKKLAFSCNYRDIGTMHHMYESCISQSNVSSRFIAPFGSEFCAEIIEVGDQVAELAPGERVIPDGTYPVRESNLIGGLPTNYASQRYEILHEKQVMKIPPTMDAVKAAAFTIGGQTIHSMLRKLGIQAGGKVLVLSATSNTSLTALRALQNYDVEVYAMTTKPNTREVLLQQGADVVLESLLVPENKTREFLKKEKLVFNYIIDPFFDLHLPSLLPFIDFNGKYVTCGYYRQHESFPIMEHNSNLPYQSIIRTLLLKNITVIGNCLGNKQDLENALDDYRRGKFDIRIDSVYSGDQIGAFLFRSFNDQDRLGKVVYRYE